MKFKAPKMNNFFRKHGSKISIGIGIAAGAGAIVTAVTGTIKATKLVEAKKKAENKEKLTKKEVIKTVWKCYIPTAGLAVVAGASTICGATNSWKQIGRLTTACALGEANLQDYKQAVLDTIGEEKTKEVEKKKIENKASTVPMIETPVSMKTGDYLMYDSISGRFFRADWNSIENAVNRLNRLMLDEQWITVNEYLDALNLPSVCDALGEMGWDIEHGYINIYKEAISTESGEAATVIAHTNEPRYIR